MIFRAYDGYMDESGTHDDSEIVAFAGYLGTYESWIDFEQEWNRVMHHFAVHDFHMAEFENWYGEFTWRNYWWWPWAEETRVRLIERVTNICQQHTIIGLGCAIIREQYEKILTENIQEDLRHPYYFCMYACLNMLLNLGPRWSTASGRVETRIDSIKPINFLFDQKQGRFRLGSRKISWEAQAQDFFQRIKNGLDPEGTTLGSLTFDSRHDYPQLRAADVIVYETAKMARQRWRDPERPMRKSMEVLGKDYNLLITFPNQQRMRNFVTIVQTAIEAMNRGASEEELDQIEKRLREEISDQSLTNEKEA